MKDGEFSFGGSANFEELVKKYKSIETEDDEATAAQPVTRLPEPEEDADSSFEQELGSVFESINHQQPEADEDDYDDDDDDDDDDDEIEDEDDAVLAAFESDDDEEEEEGSFSFDGILLHDEPEDEEPEMVIRKEEPKFAYDLNMFGSAPTSNFNVDSFDDSWLDSSLDDSIFYDPAAPVAAEIAQEPVPEPELTELPEEQEEPEAEPQVQAEAEPESEPSEQEQIFVPAAEPVNNDLAAFAGGYVASSNADSFTFDPDSGLDFGEEEEQTASAAVDESLAGLPVFTPAMPDKKSSKLKKKKETKAMTEFSKDYKVGGDDGKPAKKGNFFTRNFIPTKDDPASEIIRKIIMIISVLAIIGSAGYLFNDYVIMPYMNDKSMDELQNMIGDSTAVIDKQTMEEKYPGVDFPAGMLEKYADLYARNQDFVGWIKIDGLDISLPIVRGENNSKYLKTDFDGKKNKYGSIFMNCSNSVESLDYNTTLFGHYMKDEKMFGNLTQYKSVQGYKKAPVIEFNTIYGDYKWKVFAVMITNGTSDGDNGYLFNYMFTDLSSNEAVEDFLGEIKLRSIYYPEVDIALSDKILTLSTCTYELEEGRLVVMARMVRPGESESVDVDAVRFNSNPRYPQGYYDKQNLSNPYKSYSKWYPS